MMGNIYANAIERLLQAGAAAKSWHEGRCHCTLALIEYKAGNVDEAFKRLRSLHKANPVRNRKVIAECFIKCGDWEAARSLYDDSSNFPQESWARTLSREVRTQLLGYKDPIRIAYKLATLGEFDVARSLIEREESPQLDRHTVVSYDSTLPDYAACCRILGRVEQAKKLLLDFEPSKDIRESPVGCAIVAGAFAELGEEDHSMRMISQARDLLEKARKYEVNYRHLYNCQSAISMAFFRLRKNDLAFENLENSLVIRTICDCAPLIQDRESLKRLAEYLDGPNPPTGIMQANSSRYSAMGSLLNAYIRFGEKGKSLVLVERLLGQIPDVLEYSNRADVVNSLCQLGLLCTKNDLVVSHHRRLVKRIVDHILLQMQKS